MRKIVGLAAIAAVAPLVAACDISQSITVTPDGQANLVYDISLDGSMLGMMEMTRDDFCPVDTPPEGLPDGVTATVQLIEQGTTLICRMSAHGPVDLLPEALEGDAFSGDGAGYVSFVSEGNGVYAYTILIGAPEGAEDLTPPAPGTGTAEEQAESAMMMQMMAQMFAGRTFAIHVSAPAILETSGELSTVNGMPTASFVMPTYDFVFPPDGLEPVIGPDGVEYNYRFYVRFDITP